MRSYTLNSLLPKEIVCFIFPIESLNVSRDEAEGTDIKRFVIDRRYTVVTVVSVFKVKRDQG